ncbi:MULTISPECIES: AAA family ATPase [unclassified Undibacterium]|uniref:AAA family ATPase n=1 Tax=unclassified Undibacterium TaxID=2630295 RepID=UPI002AC9209C|nr:MULTISPECIES: AAA family ATPase [unclassified Undibacterium]MEB0141273.1 AAA family ATPase [Undibacterium sp. CCC2.1]MEB0174336.1 AAA family ATPase [Undibacterium sp. CCC1.1]MEB0178276.1 AAA family ATPase [Undibacterium sp. CCC3.4]MEB0217481.1 AAA family ATPase [Undibacterium sp. 5I2]WPX42724.1 AAA family ATPase [Undibacterium sp. CCC3.4]
MALERLLNVFSAEFNHQKEAKLYIFFDEVQYLKEWEIHLKSLVDSYSDYKFVVTGSAAAALKLKSNESGAGRFSNFVLPPLTFAEYLRFIQRDTELINTVVPPGVGYTANNIDALNEEFLNYLNFGGYPEAVFSDTIRENPQQFIRGD